MIMLSNVPFSVCPCPMQCMQSHWRRSTTQFMYGIVKTACIIAQAWYVVPIRIQRFLFVMSTGRVDVIAADVPVI